MIWLPGGDVIPHDRLAGQSVHLSESLCCDPLDAQAAVQPDNSLLING
jgi:hypothetical protein